MSKKPRWKFKNEHESAYWIVVDENFKICRHFQCDYFYLIQSARDAAMELAECNPGKKYSVLRIDSSFIFEKKLAIIYSRVF